MDATSELAIVQPPAYEPAYPTLSPNWNIDRDQHCRFDSGTILQLAAAGLEDRSRLLNNLSACRTESSSEEMALAAETQSAGIERRSHAGGGLLWH